MRFVNAIGLVGAVGIEPSRPLQTHKLLIPRFDKSYRNARNAQARYKKGTNAMPDSCFAEELHRRCRRPFILARSFVGRFFGGDSTRFLDAP
jgi:hypothetical protein